VDEASNHVYPPHGHVFYSELILSPAVEGSKKIKKLVKSKKLKKKLIKYIKILKKLAGSDRFQFYKLEIKKSKSNRTQTKPNQKTKPNRFELVFTLKI
jgi:hypothetical protein